MPGVKADEGVVLTTHPYLAPKLKKSTAISLPPVCELMAGYRVNFAFYRHISHNLRSTLSQA